MYMGNYLLVIVAGFWEPWRVDQVSDYKSYLILTIYGVGTYYGVLSLYFHSLNPYITKSFSKLRHNFTQGEKMAPTYNASTTAAELVDHLAAEIQGKVILTTGPSPNSIGATFVETITRSKPATLILAGRNTVTLQQTADAINAVSPQVSVRLLQLDLASLSSVRQAASEVNSWSDLPHIDILVNNAGIMATGFALTADGYESQFATNHLGPFLFTNLVMDKILNSPSPRVVNVSSDGHRLSPIRWGDYNFQVG